MDNSRYRSSEAEPIRGMEPKKFLLWMFIVAIIMLFAGFTSGYIVRRAEGNWLQFDLPLTIWINTLMILLSSVSMIAALRSARQDEISRVKMWLLVTFLLGLGFCIGQFYTLFIDLPSRGIYFSVSGPGVSGSFLIAIAAVHIIHILGGLVWTGILMFQASRFKVHKKNLLNISLANTYWHFIGLLWVYLLIFFYVFR
jgi:cytochrome c oxidase subunit III